MQGNLGALVGWILDGLMMRCQLVDVLRDG